MPATMPSSPPHAVPSPSRQRRLLTALFLLLIGTATVGLGAPDARRDAEVLGARSTVPAAVAGPETDKGPGQLTLALRTEFVPPLLVRGQASGMTAIRVSNDGAFAVTTDNDRFVALWDLPSRRLIRGFLGHTACPRDAAMSPDGKYIVSGGDDRVLRLWEVARTKQVRQMKGHEAPVTSVAWSPDGRRVLSSSRDGTIRLWNAQTGAIVRTLRGHEGAVLCVCCSPDGARALSAGADGTVRLWALGFGTELHRLTGHTGAATCIAFTPDGFRAGSGGEDHSVRLWDLDTGKEVRRFEGHESCVRAIAFSPDGKKLYTAATPNGPKDGNERAIRAWHVASGKELQQVETGAVHRMSVLPDGRSVAVIDEGKPLPVLWSLPLPLDEEYAGPARRFDLRGPTLRVAAASGDGKRAWLAGDDGTVHQWDLERSKKVAVHRLVKGQDGDVLALSPEGHALLRDRRDVCVVDGEGKELVRLAASSAGCAAFSPDGACAVTGGREGAVVIWDLETGKRLRRLEEHADTVRIVAFDPSGQYVVSAGDDRTIRVSQAGSGKTVGRISAGHEVVAVAISPDGRRLLASGERNGGHLMYDVATGRELQRFRGHTGLVTAVAFAPQSSLALSGGEDGSVRVWDTATGLSVEVFRGHAKAVNHVAFSRGTKLALSASPDGTAYLWCLPSAIPPISPPWRSLLGHAADRIVCVALSPDGRKVLTGDTDGGVRLWDLSAGRELGQLIGHKGGVTGVAFLPEGRALTCGQDGTLRRWRLENCKEEESVPTPVPQLSLAVPADGKHAVTTTADKAFVVWDLTKGCRPIGQGMLPDLCVRLCFASDGRRVLAACSDGFARMWDAPTGLGLLEMSVGSSVTGVAFSPDGKRAATSSVDGKVRLWNTETGHELARLEGHTNIVEGVAFTSDGRHVVSGSFDGTLRTWDARTGEELSCARCPTGTIVCTPDGKQLVTITARDSVVRVMPMPDVPERPVQVRAIPNDPIEVGRARAHVWVGEGPRSAHHTAFSPGGQTYLAGGENGTIRVWDLATGEQIQELKGHKGSTNAAVFVPGRSMVVSGGQDRMLRLWDLTTGKAIGAQEAHEKPITWLSVSADGKTALSGSADGTVRIWRMSNATERFRVKCACAGAFSSDRKEVITWGLGELARHEVATGKELGEIKGDWSALRTCTPLPDGRLLAVMADDVRWLDWPSGKELRRLDVRRGRGPITNFGLSPDGRRLLVSLGSEQVVRLWDLEAGEEIAGFIVRERPLGLYSFSPDGRHAVVGSQRGFTFVLRLPDDVPADKPGATRICLGHAVGPVHSLAVAADGKTVWSMGPDLRRWDLPGWHICTGLPSPVAMDGAILSPNGRRMAALGCGLGLGVLEVPAVKPIRPLFGVGMPHWWTAAWLPDNRRLLTGGDDGVARVWDTDEGKPVHELRGHGGPVRCVAVSPHGQQAITGSDADQVLRLWDLKTGKELRHVAEQLNRPGSACFVADGKRALSCGADGVIRLLRTSDLSEVCSFTAKGKGLVETDRLCLLPDGKHFLSAADDRVLRLWRLSDAKEIYRATLPAKPSALALTADSQWALIGTSDGPILRHRLPDPTKGDGELSEPGVFLPIPVPPWVTERMDKNQGSEKEARTPVLPPLRGHLATCEEPPDEARILRAMPRQLRLGGLYHEKRDNVQIVTELLVDRIDPPRFFPLVGPAQQHHCHWKCSVYYTEVVESSYPFPIRIVKPRIQVVYIDTDHLHLFVGDDVTPRKIAEALIGW